MRIGAIFPQLESGEDPAAIRDFVQAVEGLGYDHVLVFDHVLGAHPDRFGFKPPYNHHSVFHEPFVLFGFLAAATERIELATGIIILPQRQTALVAKQAAEADLLSGGRLRLGVGIGWNHVEFEALNEEFHNRGRRVEEQIALMRRLWTEQLMDFEGKYHSFTQAGLRPLPVQRPIPVWMGGGERRAVERIARIADGWLPQFGPGDDGAMRLERIRGQVRDAGRNPDAFGIEGRIAMATTPEDQWESSLMWWREQRASHLSFATMGLGLSFPAGHIDAMRRFIEVARA